MKRILALLLCLVMCASLIPASCAEGLEDVEDIEIIDIDDGDEPVVVGTLDDSEEEISIIDPETVAEQTASKPTITTQPASKTAYVGTMVKFTVKATGATSYQWYYRRNADASWARASSAGNTTATLSLEATTARSGFQFKCAVKNAAGTTYSSVATLTVSKKPVITTQPKSVSAAAGSKATFTVKATGATSYQWQYRTSAAGTWKNSKAAGADTATLTVTANASYSGFQHRCKVMNASGTTYSSAATLTVLSEKPTITTQPASKTAYVGTTVKFTVKATGATSYQWYYRRNADASWTKASSAGNATATLSLEATTARSGFQFKCAVKNAVGTTYSSAATLTVSKKPVITTQPKSVSAAAGSKATFTVKATGATSYQWQYRTSAAGTWKNSKAAGADTATLTVTANASYSGFQHRCKVMNASGTTYSSAATLTVLSEKPTITTQPMSYTASVGATVKFTVQASGAESYQWYYRRNADASWAKASSAGNTTATLSVPVTTARSGFQFKCAVKNAVGTRYSSVATLTASTAQCGADLHWILDGSGLLTISGTGNMYDVDYDESCWKAANIRDSILRVTIENGVTGLGDSAFHGCGSLTGITIPDSVTRLGDSAFHGCGSLTGITIPNSVTVVGGGVFYGCVGLKNVSLGNGIKDLACSVQCITIEPGSDGEVYVQTYYYGFFEGCSALTGITIPDSVTHIGEEAFSCCSALTSVTIPDSVTVVGGGVFFCCSALETVSIGRGITSLPSVCFEEDMGYHTEYYGFFEGCSALTGITIPDSVTHIGEDAFSRCSALTSITIPDSVTDIGGGVFYGCSSLETAIIGRGVKALNTTVISEYDHETGFGFFEGCHMLSHVSIPSGVDSIGDRAFADCRALTSITIPDSVVNVGGGVFYGCSSLRSAVIGTGITALPAYAVLDEYGDTTEYNGFFEDCGNLSDVTIPAGMTYIGRSAFNCCDRLTDVYYRGTRAQWEEISIEEGNARLNIATIHYNA